MGQRLLLLIVLSMFVALLLSILLFLSCFRRWRSRRSFLDLSLLPCPPSSSPSRLHPAQVEDLETPLFSEHLGRQKLLGKQTTFSTDLHSKQDGSLVLDIASNTLENVHIGQTLKYTAIPIRLHDEKYIRREAVNYDLEKLSDDNRFQAIDHTAYKRTSLNLEVISGPAVGLHFSRDFNNSQLQVTLGRVPPSDLLLKDSEVSGKHAIINWNSYRCKWELVDMGSLNGTFLNSQAVHHPDSARRQMSDPVGLANGDIITLGTSSRILVKLVPSTVYSVPFAVGMASEPMAMRRGGKKLPMEDVSYCQWPLPGLEQFGLFGIFDGHGGAGAAKSASKMLPKIIANILTDYESRAHVISHCDASKVFTTAFLETEAAMDHQYEGCTATVLLVWVNGESQLFAQCANVGDSACVMNIGGQLITMTEDHRVTSVTEQARLRATGKPLEDGESRLCGINLVRMLGDKFLKAQESRFSAQPFISQAVHVDRRNVAFALIASDGLWDVISMKKVVQLILKEKQRDIDHENNADWIANLVLNEAKALRTKDNTSVIFLDFESKRTDHCNTKL